MNNGICVFNYLIRSSLGVTQTRTVLEDVLIIYRMIIILYCALCKFITLCKSYSRYWLWVSKLMYILTWMQINDLSYNATKWLFYVYLFCFFGRLFNMMLRCATHTALVLSNQLAVDIFIPNPNRLRRSNFILDIPTIWTGLANRVVGHWYIFYRSYRHL